MVMEIKCCVGYILSMGHHCVLLILKTKNHSHPPPAFHSGKKITIKKFEKEKVCSQYPPTIEWRHQNKTKEKMGN